MTTALKLCVLESSPKKSLAMAYKLYKKTALGECKLLTLKVSVQADAGRLHLKNASLRKIACALVF
jgi:hypothetical protein